jgi:hypothetical protein
MLLVGRSVILGWIKKSNLAIVGAFDSTVPVRNEPGLDAWGAFGQVPVSFSHASRQHLDGSVEEAELHRNTVLSCPDTAHITFTAKPHTAFVHHRHTPQHKLSGQLPLERLDGDPGIGVVDVEPERYEPFVGAHANRTVRLEPLGQRRLSGARDPAQQDQSPPRKAVGRHDATIRAHRPIG